MIRTPSKESGLPRVSLVLGVLALLGIALSVPASECVNTCIIAGLVGYLAWRFHGLLVAGLALLLIVLHGVPEQGMAPTITYLLALVGGIMAWVTADRRGGRLWLGPYGLVAAMLVLFIHQQSHHLTPEAIRMLQASGVLLVLGGLWGLVAWRRWDGFQALAVVGIALLGVSVLTIAHMARVLSPEWWSLDAWRTCGADWRAWLFDAFDRSEPWCWASAWALLPLMAIGLWQMLTRSRKQRQTGHAPTALLAGVGIGGGFLATLPENGYFLHLVAIVLPLFGVADLTQTLVERLQLTPPPDA